MNTPPETRAGKSPGQRPMRLLFLCTGNTCRSPLAESIAREEAGRRGSDVECRSAGTFAWGGQPAAANAIRVARDHGLDLGSHRSRALDAELLDTTDLVLGMDESHVEVARVLAPTVVAELITDALPPGHREHGRPVQDPIGGSVGVYAETYELLAEAIRGVFDRLEGQ
jgi:protein-tyrosine phosphatase